LIKADGNLWFNSDDGRGYVKYNNQWIEFCPPVIPNPATYLGNLTIDGAENSTLYFPPGGAIVFGDDTVQTTAYTGGGNIDFANVASNIIPSANVTYSLGNATNQWTDLWVSNSTIYMNSVPISLGEGNVLTVAGANVATTVSGAAGNSGEIQINVAGGLGADSTLRYVDNNGEMTLYADYLNAPGIFTNSIYGDNNGLDSNLTITTSYGVAAWTFKTDGSLQFPSGAGFAKGDNGQLKTNDGNTASLDFRDTSGRGFYTNSDGYTLRSNGSNNWIFGPTGNLTVPGNIIMTTGIVGSGASPAPYLSGFDSVSAVTLSASGNVTGSNVLTGGVVSATGNVRGSNLNTAGLVTATGNVTGGNILTGGQVSATGSTNTLNLITRNGDANPVNSKAQITMGYNGTTDYPQFIHTRHNAGSNLYNTIELWTSDGTQAGTFPANAILGLTVTNGNIATGGILTDNYYYANGTPVTFGGSSYGNANVVANLAALGSNPVSTTGNITAANFIGNGATLSNVATQITGSWDVPVGNSTQSFTVNSGTYSMWVDCNIPNGILVWNATATVTNTNVPVVGYQYAWVYNGGGTPVDFTSIPNQFVGTANTIVRSNTAPSATTNRFDFGINNTSGGNVTVRYGYTKL
jgi:hypothetical protein